jgi:cobalamin synthase
MAQQYETLSFGVLMVIIALMLVAYATAIVTDLGQMMALIIGFYGVWTVILAGIRMRNPEKYGRGAQSTLTMGIVLIAIGGAWLLLTAGISVILAIALLIVIVGILAVVSALPSFRRKPE